MQMQFDEICKKDWGNYYLPKASVMFGLQSVGNENPFLENFSLRLNDTAKQSWSGEVTASSKLWTHKAFKSLLIPEIYLAFVNSYFIRRQLTKFRRSDHLLMIGKGRHHGLESNYRKCKCWDMTCSEDDFHFLLVCPL